MDENSIYESMTANIHKSLNPQECPNTKNAQFQKCSNLSHCLLHHLCIHLYSTHYLFFHFLAFMVLTESEKKFCFLKVKVPVIIGSVLTFPMGDLTDTELIFP